MSNDLKIAERSILEMNVYCKYFYFCTGLSSLSTLYRTDLEYLEDNFLLIETLVKAVKTELSDDTVLFRADQRKPEAVIRELKAKARSLKAKTEQKLEATRTQTGMGCVCY